MTRRVVLTISGIHYEGNEAALEEDTEPVEVLTPAVYYCKNGKHYVFYEEPVEGMPGTIKNKIKFKEGEFLEVVKSGLTNSRMVFEKGKINVTQYATPYGELTLGTYTKVLDIDVQEDVIEVYAQYSLDADGQSLAECEIKMKIEATGKDAAW